MIDTCVIATWSRTQGCIALSSAEAEYYAAATAVTEGRFVQSLLTELNFSTELVLKLDSSAAKSAIERHGCHRMKHIMLKYQFIKQLAKDGEITLEKISGKKNVADFLTKPVDGKQMWSCLELAGAWQVPAQRMTEELDEAENDTEVYMFMLETNTCPNEPQPADDKGFLWYFMTVASLVGFIVTVMIGIVTLLQAFCQKLRPKPSRTVATQSQVMYNRRLVQPRFQPLGEAQHGAFVET